MQSIVKIHSRMAILLVIIINLTITCAENATEYHELNLINKLNNFFDFDHNIFLFDSSVDIERFIKTSGKPTPHSLYVFQSVDDNIIGLEVLKEISSKNTFVIVVPGSAKYESNVNLLTRLKRIQLLKVDMKIGILFQQIVSSEDLMKLFKWSWEHKIINIFAATQSESLQGFYAERPLSIFSFNPFGTFDVLNVGDSESYHNFFLSQNCNFQQYPIDFGVPKLSAKNFNGKLWIAILGIINASDANNNKANMLKISTSPNIVDPERERHNLYPVKLYKTVIVVPEALPYPEFAAYLQAFASHTLLVYSFLITVTIILFLSMFRFKRRTKFLVFESVADVLNLLMNDNGYIKYQQLSGIEVLLIVPLTFAGLIIVNGILSTLQSYLTQPYLQPQIDTIVEIYKSPIPIYTYHVSWTEKAIRELTNRSEHGNWTDKVRAINYVILFDQMVSFNKSISFMIDMEYADILLRVQKRLNIKGYYKSQVQFSSELMSFIVDDDFPFKERVNEITHRIISSRLYELWNEQNLATIEKGIMKKNLELLRSREATKIESFEVPMFIVYGWIASIIVFMIEVIWKQTKSFHKLFKKSRRF